MPLILPLDISSHSFSAESQKNWWRPFLFIIQKHSPTLHFKHEAQNRFSDIDSYIFDHTTHLLTETSPWSLSLNQVFIGPFNLSTDFEAQQAFNICLQKISSCFYKSTLILIVKKYFISQKFEVGCEVSKCINATIMCQENNIQGIIKTLTSQ